MITRVSGLIAAVLVTSLALAGCSGNTARLPRDMLVVLEAGDAPTLNPLYSSNEYAAVYDSLIFDPLVGMDAHYRAVPWLATSWTSTPDHLHYTVRLRRGVTWSDGAPFSSKDVVFTWHAYLDPAAGFYYSGQYYYIEDVVALGPYTVRFDLKQPNALFLLAGYANGVLSWPILPYHILGKIPPAQLRTSDFGEHPIGTGPYMLERWKHDQELVFVRNPHWWHGLPKIKTIDVRVVLNPQAEREDMEDGNADFFDGMGSGDYEQLRRDYPDRFRLLHIPDLYTSFVQTNDALPGLHDVSVRQAMIYGWDRRALVDGLIHHDALVSTGIVPHGLPEWRNPDVARYPYDPARARALLESDGWKPGPDGVRRRGATRLEFELVLPNAGPAGYDLAAEFQADMQAIGVKIDVKTLDYATFIQDMDRSAYQLAYTGWGGTPDPDQFTFLDSSQFPPAGNNTEHYVNHAVDRVLREGLRKLDPRKRKAIYDEMQRLTAQDPPVIWGYDVYYRAAFSKRVDFNGTPVLPDQYIWNYVWAWSLKP